MILNLTPDHLPWHGTDEAYRAAKLRLFEHQGPDAIAVGPRDLLGRRRRGGAARDASAATRRTTSPSATTSCGGAGERLLALEELRLRGVHNARNAAAAARGRARVRHRRGAGAATRCAASRASSTGSRTSARSAG